MSQAATNGKCCIVIFGGNGDLATRMLLPSLYFLHRDKYLPENVSIVGVARSQLSSEDYRELVLSKLKKYIKPDDFSATDWQSFASRLSYNSADADDAASFQRLANTLQLTAESELVCYLSTAPKLFGKICLQLQQAGMVTERTRVILEKPVGHSLESSEVINDAVAKIFSEEKIFRIDHYLGKETVQNILALRFANSLFEPLWNGRDIDHVQITISETVGVEGRWSYYNETGALRDMLQNHMLQLLALIAMEPPREFTPDAVRNEKVKVLRSLRPLIGADVETNTVRGQYTAGVAGSQSVPGYCEEQGGVSDSQTETFVAMRAHIDNWRWAGVPFYLRTGKRLPNRFSEIYIQFRDVPYSIFSKSGAPTLKPNKLIIGLQPEENIKLMLMNKLPGLMQKSIQMREVELNLSLSDAIKKERRRTAYERLFLDIIHNDATLFVRRDEIEAAWTWADGILDSWQKSVEPPKNYPAGSWGPSSVFALTEKYGHSWHE